ncbi:helix-turn-helix domain-containing protein [Salinibacterium sp. G-O1]|uniref:TetR/AcrR family transcriptional regulator n=1 Tax=Salinibacterium sp. G-O1 TaxID=3046208 RepID=UPI0024B9816F|nr:TetR/AcrR family transcriptional regulator [Salinibacterium sp. G-O1]MDJ0333771.1 helix-turn-helix domain-containing protein [Salinibacterium sp. G-O1]
MTTTRAPRRDAAENRDALLAAARVELNLDADASLEAIATRAGLSRRSVYGHFATRDELLRELLTSGATRVSHAMAGVDHPDPTIRLALIASRLWFEVDDIRVMAVFAVRGPLKTHTAAALQPLRDRVLAAVVDGVALGELRTDIPAGRLARLVEDSALSALAASSRDNIAAPEAHRLAMLLVLSTVGLSATEAAAVIDGTPELAWPAR